MSSSVWDELPNTPKSCVAARRSKQNSPGYGIRMDRLHLICEMKMKDTGSGF